MEYYLKYKNLGFILLSWMTLMIRAKEWQNGGNFNAQYFSIDTQTNRKRATTTYFSCRWKNGFDDSTNFDVVGIII